jgi:hypothetical protein
MFVLAWSRISNLHKVDFLNVRLRCLLFTEREDAALVSCNIVDLYISEAASETLKDLHLLLLSIVKLHPSVNILLIGRVKSHKEAPLLARVKPIRHYLAVS